MGKRYFAQVQKHFRFLIDEYGFAVEREVDEGRYSMVVFRQTALFRPKICQIRVPYQEGRVQVDVAPISASKDWFGLATIIQYLTPEAERRWTYDEVYDPKPGKQLENLAKVVRAHIDAILQLFEEQTFVRERPGLLACRKRREAEALARIDAKWQARVEAEGQP
ncbi:MAG: hypothetical protein JXA14_11460 [Anaerolineae bacterium]|nr:hypothetical protein [Anaerolineae bacterium]